MPEPVKAPAQPSGQSQSVGQAPAPASTTPAKPHFEYEWEDGKKDTFATEEDLKRAWREGALRHRDYTKKTQELSEQRKQYETEKRQLETTAAEIRRMQTQWQPVDEFLKTKRPDIAQYILSQMRNPSPQVAQRQTQNLITTQTKALETKLKELEEWKQEQELERRRDQLYSHFQGQYPDFDPEGISEDLAKINEVPEDDSLRHLIEMIYYARKGRMTPAQIEQRIAESSAAKNGKRPPVPSAVAPGGRQTTPIPKTIREAAENYKKRIGVG